MPKGFAGTALQLGGNPGDTQPGSLVLLTEASLPAPSSIQLIQELSHMHSCWLNVTHPIHQSIIKDDTRLRNIKLKKPHTSVEP